MQTFVVSDNEAISIRVREKLVRSGHDCPDSHVVPLNYGSRAVDVADLIVVVMSPNPENALVVLREMQRAIRATNEQKFLLAVGPPDARLILRTIQVADDYVDETEVNEALEPVLVKIMSSSAAREEPGKVIAILSPSGGSGSSVVATNLATVLAKEHRSCALLDLKLGAGVCDALLDLKPTHTLADLCRNADRMDRGMFERLLTRHSSGLQLMAPPTSFAEIGYITGQGVRQALTMCRGLFPYVVVDCDRTYSEEQVEVLRQADLLLMVLRLDFTSLRNVRQAMEHLEQLGVDRNRVRLVINRLGQPKEVSLSKAEVALGMKVFKTIPNDPPTVNKATNNGIPVVVDAPRSTVARSLLELAKDVSQQTKT